MQKYQSINMHQIASSGTFLKPHLKLLCFIEERKYEILLCSFLLMIFGNTFAISNHVISIMDIYQNFVICFFIFLRKKWMRNFIAVTLLLFISLDVFENQLSFIDARSWHGIIYLIFFFRIAIEIFKKIFYTKTVSREMLSAALCGFVVLCLIATFVSYQINVLSPDSFSNAGDKKDMLNNLNYFSFTTLLTIGYGDITPLTIVAKRTVMLVGICGHFYTVFVTSIIIGKYLSSNNYLQIQNKN